MLTPEEQFRLQGTLPAHQIETLLDTLAAVPDVSGAIIHIKEARNPFNAEDFLSEVLSDLSELIKSTRGENKSKAQALHAKLEDIQMTVFYACDHANDELKQALTALGG